MPESKNPKDSLTENLAKMEQLVQAQIQQAEKLIASTQKNLESYKPMEMGDNKLDDHLKAIQQQAEKTLADAVKTCEDSLKTLIDSKLTATS